MQGLSLYSTLKQVISLQSESRQEGVVLLAERALQAVFNLWRLVEDERVIVAGPFVTNAAYTLAGQLTNATGHVHVAVQIGSEYENVLVFERVKWLEQLLKGEVNA